MRPRHATLCFLSYNRPEFVVQSITTAVINAGYPVEVLVHDDGSDVATRDALLELRDKGMISTLLLNAPGHNEGQGVALNRMFRMATGDPIIKLDHDLLFSENWLGRAMFTLLVNGGSRAPQEPRIGALGLFRYGHPPVKYEDMFIREWGEWEEHQDFVGSAMVIPRRAFNEFGPFSERSEAFAEDNEFKLKITAAEGWAVGLLKEDVVRNQGFGPGPSTIVNAAGDGTITVTKIKEGPKVIG